MTVTLANVRAETLHSEDSVQGDGMGIGVTRDGITAEPPPVMLKGLKHLRRAVRECDGTTGQRLCGDSSIPQSDGLMSRYRILQSVMLKGLKHLRRAVRECDGTTGQRLCGDSSIPQSDGLMSCYRILQSVMLKGLKHLRGTVLECNGTPHRGPLRARNGIRGYKTTIPS